MKSNETPKIAPLKTQEFDSKQSKYGMVPQLPCRSVILGPSGTGKTVLLTNLITHVYRDCFSRVYIFSPSINVDASWRPVKAYIEKEMKVDHTEEEPIYFDHYDPAQLQKVITTQHKVSEFMKKRNAKSIYQVLVVVDDFADEPSFSRHSKLLHSLYTRGRHTFISSLTATQAFTAISPLIRKNATELYIYRLRNYKDLDAFLEEVSAIYDKKTLLEIYQLATSQPYSFLFCNLRAHNKSDMFYMNFDKKISVEES